MEETICDVYWEGPFDWDKRDSLRNPKHVLYAIYRTHYVYGQSALLYIGMTETTIADRLAIATDGTYEIHDYKTSKSLPTQKDKDEDKQLALYQIGVRNMWSDAHSLKLLWHYLVFNKEMSSSRTAHDIERLRAEQINGHSLVPLWCY